MAPPISALRVQGQSIVDGTGAPVRLTGVGVGGWLKMENFISGYPGTEQDVRHALGQVLGQDSAHVLFESILTNFFGAADAAFLKGLGLNHIRLPINYRHLLDDEAPDELLETGYRHIDRAVAACEDAGLYVIFDLHALPGFQNQEWHSDNPTHRALLWGNEIFFRQTERIWRGLAERYGARPAVAGYNLVNEPGDPSDQALIRLYVRLHDAIRDIDSSTMIFLDGNRYSTEFGRLLERDWDNVVFAVHDYALPGLIDGGEYPGVTRGRYVDRRAVEEVFHHRAGAILSAGYPVWVGEFGPVYVDDESRNEDRYRLLMDQLALYGQYGAHWAIWTYKDLGLQGLVTLKPGSAWSRLIAPLVEKKRRLGADAWGTTDEGVAHLVRPLIEFIEGEFPTYDPYPFGVRRRVSRLVRHILFTEPLVEEFAELFNGLNERELTALGAAFSLSACNQHDRLCDILRQSAEWV